MKFSVISDADTHGGGAIASNSPVQISSVGFVNASAGIGDTVEFAISAVFEVSHDTGSF